jgi:hypothetical protein
MKSIPVDDRRFQQLVVAVPPRQQTKAHPITGEVMWDVDLFVIADERPDLLRVAVPDSGLAKNLAPGGAVRVGGLTVVVWEKDGRHGQMFRCDALSPATAVSASSKPAAA